MTLFNLSSLFKDPLLPYSHILWSQGLELQHVNESDMIQPITKLRICHYHR